MTGTAGKTVFLLSSTFMTLNVCDSVLYHEQAENIQSMGRDSGFSAHSFEKKGGKKQQINIHTLSKQTDCCLAEVLIT